LSVVLDVAGSCRVRRGQGSFALRVAGKKFDTTALSPLRGHGAAPAPKVRGLARVHSETDGAAMEWFVLDTRRRTIGREPGVDRIAIDDPEASRKHAEVEYVADSDVYRVRDLESRNHTYLDGQKVESDYLLPGSVIRIGGTLFVYAEAILDTGVVVFEPETGVALSRSRAERLIDVAAKSALPIMIRGPTGAGKELLAQRAHKASGRKGPLVSVNCATFSKELLASELFGHTQGAFSGAQTARSGLFVSAAGGTLFLDEIAELPLEQQPALLRALQEGKVRPVGSDKEIPVDVRVITASHRTLDAEVASGTFRADLLGRLAGFRVELPGLNERREEVLSLFSRFGPELPPLASASAELLVRHGWPLNVRELKHLAERLKLLASHAARIEPEMLPDDIRRALASSGGGDTSAADDEAPSKAQMEKLLAEHGGNVAQVARAIGRHRQQLYRWLKKYDLDPIKYRPPE